jgi:uncharacterized alkaline shock family protein YloU
MRPENKVDLGVIQVHTNVIADICAEAIADVEGVALLRNESLESLCRIVGIRKNTAVQVQLEADGQVRRVVVKVTVRYGLNLSDISRRVQDSVMTAVERMADVNLRDVDVSIEGIQRG